MSIPSELARYPSNFRFLTVPRSDRLMGMFQVFESRRITPSKVMSWPCTWTRFRA